jgi:hypothetical protein
MVKKTECQSVTSVLLIHRQELPFTYQERAGVSNTP